MRTIRVKTHIVETMWAFANMCLIDGDVYAIKLSEKGICVYPRPVRIHPTWCACDLCVGVRQNAWKESEYKWLGEPFVEKHAPGGNHCPDCHRPFNLHEYKTDSCDCLPF